MQHIQKQSLSTCAFKKKNSKYKRCIPSYHIHLWNLSFTKSLAVFGCVHGTLFCKWVIRTLRSWCEPRQGLGVLEMEMTGVQV